MNVVKVIVAAMALLFAADAAFAQRGGNLECYGGKNGGGKVLNRHMNSAHNCCTGNGKSWSCNGAPAVNCSAVNSFHCP
jgi:hypothetical protein